ncbi:unnamed protein product [Arabis nemorensis]|uniref:Uncharacterized protein n=1 Tax=Arabis nemorensis TaxID=586526 RepID=A0A565BCN9_9BRAS|nr:unnamed protein product [Arabis nemorensis]
MVERFFPTNASSGDGTRRREHLTLLSGPISSGKTSLLFQFAINVATASESNRVVFICRRKRIETNPPFFSQGIDTSSDVLNRIQIKNSKGSVMNSRGRDMAMVRTLALCHNAIVDANKKTACELVLSETNHGDSPRSLFIYKRWIQTIFTIRGHGDGSFLLRSDGTSEKSAKYSIALQYLILEEMVNG